VTVDDLVLTEAIVEHFPQTEHRIVHLALHDGPSSRTEDLSVDDWSVQKWNLLNVWHTDAAGVQLALRAADGSTVATLPSVLRLLADRIDRGRWSPAGLVLSGEAIAEDDLVAARAVLGSDPLVFYTSAEFGILGIGCPDGGYHENADAVYVEMPPVGSKPRPALVTGLINRAMPLIRYELGDALRQLPPCDCGRIGRRFEVLTDRSTRVGEEEVLVVERSIRRRLAGLGMSVRDRRRRRGRVVLECTGTRALTTSELKSLDVVGRLSGANTVRVAESGSYLTLDVAAPSGPLTWLESVIGRLVPLLRELRDLVGAAIVGSAIDPLLVTRFSDIDVLVVTCSPPRIDDWIPLLRTARSALPGLALLCDGAADLPRRAPLLTCRLAAHHYPLLGSDALSAIDLPAIGAIETERHQFLVAARIELIDLASSDRLAELPVAEVHWRVVRRVLDAVRLRRLTEAAVLDRGALPHLLAPTELISALTRSMHAALQVAREAVPPPTPDANGRVVLEGIRFLEDELGSLLAEDSRG
jgi:hypothetical protein